MPDKDDLKFKEKINQIYLQGKSLRWIGRHLKISHESVRHYLNPEIIRKNTLDEEYVEKVIGIYKKTKSFQKTADELNVKNRQKIFRIVKSYYK